MNSTERQLISLQVGRPRAMEFEGKAWTSGIYKLPVEGRVMLDRTNLAGDGQADTRHHGGLDKAVCCFAAEHYPYWRDEFGLGPEFVYGAFGENFTLTGMKEEDVCIGDVYSAGSARVQVCQARIPCANLSRKWNRQEMPERMMVMGHTGYYLRVLQSGEVGAGDTLTLLERPQPEITISVINRAMYQNEGGSELAARLAHLPELAPAGRRIFQRHLNFRAS